ncbi:MAG: peptidase T [Solirubrobacteraceae bacterium]|nr:peptidase T [Solirubrobacteraceae bacterium]
MSSVAAAAPYSSPLAASLAEDVLARLDRYARIDTQAGRGERAQSPSTPGQLDLSRLLVAELLEIGLSDAVLDDHGYVTATLGASEGLPPETRTIGFIAHVDVSPDAPAEGVRPIVHRAYDGGIITLPNGGTVLDPERMPALARKVGHDLITSSGDTLLGADDKAGVAEIMAAVAHLAAHPELPRPTIRVCFTPDEEIGEGATLFDIDAFGAYCAYTMDGSEIGELQDETFTAAEVVIEVTGVDVHPGFATGKLVNAATVASHIVAALPTDRLTPTTTSGREGFVHVFEVSGDAGHAKVATIVRDFDDDLLAGHVAFVRETAERIAADWPGATVAIKDRRQYPNMRDHLKPFPDVVAKAEAAIAAEGLTPKRTSIRGGTDGSVLSARGLPTPNIFTGGHEFHSVREWASVHDMASAAAVIVHLAEAWTKP